MNKIKVSEIFSRKSFLICFIIIISAVAAFMRIYRLTDLPNGTHIDEAGLGYNAFCIANYGVDRYLNVYPIYPKNFYGGQSAFYTYLCAGVIKLFYGGHLSKLVVRMPMVVISMIAFYAGLFILWKLFEKKWFVLGAIVYTTVPYFIMQSRLGLDCNAYVNVLTIAVALLVYAVEKNKWYLYALTGTLFGITYYTYALSYVADTIIIIVVCLYLLYCKKAKLTSLIAMVIPAVIIAIPLLVFVIINTFGLADIVTPFFSIAKTSINRGSQFVLNPLSMIKTIPTVFKVILFNDGLAYSSFNGFYTMYIISVPFLLIGLCCMLISAIKSVKNKEYSHIIIFFWIFVVQFICGLGLGNDSPQIHRLNGIFFAQTVIVIYGIKVFTFWVVSLYIRFTKKSSTHVYRIVVAIVSAIYLISFVLFAKFYFVNYKYDVYPQQLFSDIYVDVLEKLEEDGKLESNTYVCCEIIYYQFSTEMDPYSMVNTPGANLGQYKNYTFAIDDHFQRGDVYIIRREDERNRQKALDAGMRLQYEADIFNVYY